jgi:hypothetical protein
MGTTLVTISGYCGGRVNCILTWLVLNQCVWLGIVAGDVPRVDGQLAVARAFGDKSLKVHLSAQPDIKQLEIDEGTEFLILASDGLWKVSILNSKEGF